MTDPVKVGGKVEAGLPRIRTCLRCERLADDAYKVGLPRPVVSEARSWVTNGIRYWAGLCVGCGQWEREQRERLQREQENRR